MTQLVPNLAQAEQANERMTSGINQHSPVANLPQGSKGKNPVVPNSAQREKGKTRDKLAEIAGGILSTI